MAKEVVIYSGAYSIETKTSTYGRINHTFKFYFTNYSLINNTADLYISMKSQWDGTATSYRTNSRGLVVSYTFNDADGMASLGFCEDEKIFTSKTFYEDTPVAGQPSNIHTCTWERKLCTINFNEDLDVWSNPNPTFSGTLACYDYFGYDHVYRCSDCGYTFLEVDYVNTSTCPTVGGAHSINNPTSFIESQTPSMTGYQVQVPFSTSKFLPVDVMPASNTYLYTGSSFDLYSAYIFDKTANAWNLYNPYIYDGEQWHAC